MFSIIGTELLHGTEFAPEMKPAVICKVTVHAPVKRHHQGFISLQPDAQQIHQEYEQMIQRGRNFPMGPGGPGGPGPGPGGPWGPGPGGPGFFPGGFFGGFADGICSMISSCLYCLCCCWLIQDCFGGRGGYGPPGGPPPPF